MNTIGFKAQGWWGRVQIKSIKSNLIKCRFLRRGENRSTRGKTSQSREENQQTQPTCDTEVGNRTRVTLVGGECSHHYAITALFHNSAFESSWEGRVLFSLVPSSCSLTTSYNCTWMVAIPQDQQKKKIKWWNIGTQLVNAIGLGRETDKTHCPIHLMTIV